MKIYEAVVVYPVQTAGDVHQEGKSPFEDAVKKLGGKISGRIEIGRRPLGYVIKKAREAIFVAYTFEVLPENVAPLKRELRLSENVLSSTITVFRERPKRKVKVRRQKKQSQPVTAAIRR